VSELGGAGLTNSVAPTFNATLPSSNCIRFSQSVSQYGPSLVPVRRFAAETKKKKDAPPKRGASAFALFVKDKFPEYKKEGAPATEATSNIAAAWKRMSADQKQPWITTSNDLKATQSKLREAWAIAHPKITRPLTGYMRFITERRTAAGDSIAKGREAMLKFTKDVASEWRALPESKKSVYNSAFTADMAKYNERPDKMRLDAKELTRVREKKRREAARKERNRELRAQGLPIKRRRKAGTAAPAKKKKSSMGKSMKKSTKKKTSMKKKKRVMRA